MGIPIRGLSLAHGLGQPHHPHVLYELYVQGGRRRAAGSEHSRGRTPPAPLMPTPISETRVGKARFDEASRAEGARVNEARVNLEAWVNEASADEVRAEEARAEDARANKRTATLTRGGGGGVPPVPVTPEAEGNAAPTAAQQPHRHGPPSGGFSHEATPAAHPKLAHLAGIASCAAALGQELLRVGTLEELEARMHIRNLRQVSLAKAVTANWLAHTVRRGGPAF